MSENFRNSLFIRQLRATLIKDGIAEDKVDAFLQQLREEFLGILNDDDPEKLRLPFEKIGLHLARMRLGETADPKELDRYAKRYDQHLLAISDGILVAIIAEGGSAIRRGLSSPAPRSAHTFIDQES